MSYHKSILTPICRTNLPMEKIHDAGAKRHRELWLGANQRIVDTARAHGMDLSVQAVKETLSEIALRVLDGLQIDKGNMFDKEKEEWVKRI